MRHYGFALMLPFALTLLTFTPTLAGDPAAQLEEQIGRVFQTLADPALSGADQAAERRATIRRLAGEIFDWNETAKRALGSQWTGRTPEEQARFVRAFTDLIDHSYLRKVDKYGGERVVVTGQQVDGDDATVHTDVVAADGDRIPVDFLMRRDAAGRWRACDAKVGGVSLVGSYRSQFNKIIQTGSYETLLTRLEAKVGASAR